MKPNEYLTTGQVARLLDVSARRVIQLADEGRLPHERVGPGGMRLFEPAGVQTLLDLRSPEAAA